MASTVTIKYNGVAVDVDRQGLNIAPIFLPTNSYVDTDVFVNGNTAAGYGKSIYATNVYGLQFMNGITPDATNTARFAMFYRAVKAAADAAAAGETNTGVTFTVDDYKEELYWNQMADAMAVEGFDVKVTEVTP